MNTLHSQIDNNSGGRRTRWVGTEKEREDMLQIEKQHNQERERLRKQKRRTEDIEDIKCTTEGRLLVNSGERRQYENYNYKMDKLTKDTPK